MLQVSNMTYIRTCWLMLQVNVTYGQIGSCYKSKWLIFRHVGQCYMSILLTFGHVGSCYRYIYITYIRTRRLVLKVNVTYIRTRRIVLQVNITYIRTRWLVNMTYIRITLAQYYLHSDILHYIYYSSIHPTTILHLTQYNIRPRLDHPFIYSTCIHLSIPI